MVLLKQLVQRVILVGRNNHLGDWQAHFLCDVACIHLGKTRCRHAETDRTLATPQLQHGVEVKHQLRQHTDPVTRVETDHLVLRIRPLSEQPGDDGLALVEAAIHCKLMNPWVRRCLQMLELLLRHTRLRVKHHHGGVLAVLERLDGRQPGIAVGGTDHHPATPALTQKIRH
ncbi:hypothetical protein D3C72_1630860 [compost metagenome]